MRTLVGWCGMRGAVSLAAALALPLDFPQRDIVLFLTFAVIFATLVLQGLTLPALIRLPGHRRRRRRRARGAARPPRRGRRRARAARRAARRAEWTRDDTADADAADVRVPAAPVRDPRRRGRRHGRTEAVETPLAPVPEDGPVGAHRAARGGSSSCATPARSPTRSCTGSSASWTSRTSAWRSRGHWRGQVAAGVAEGETRGRVPTSRRRGDVRPVVVATAGVEPGVEDLAELGLGRRAQRQREHVGVVPLARAVGRLGVAAQRGADAVDLVGGDRRARCRSSSTPRPGRRGRRRRRGRRPRTPTPSRRARPRRALRAAAARGRGRAAPRPRGRPRRCSRRRRRRSASR